MKFISKLTVAIYYLTFIIYYVSPINYTWKRQFQCFAVNFMLQVNFLLARHEIMLGWLHQKTLHISTSSHKWKPFLLCAVLIPILHLHNKCSFLLTFSKKHMFLQSVKQQLILSVIYCKKCSYNLKTTLKHYYNLASYKLVTLKYKNNIYYVLILWVF